MARAFGNVIGAGTTDVIQTGLTTTNQQRSYWYWIWLRTAPSGVTYRAFDQSNFTSTVNETQFFSSGTTAATFGSGWSGGQATWTTTSSLSTATWHSLGWSYDFGSTSNNPIGYLDGTKLTVGSGLTAGTAPSGTHGTAANNLYIGNVNAGTRVLDGRMAGFVVWNIILTDLEFAALGRGIQPYNIRPASLAGWWPIDGIQSPEPDLSGNKLNGTLTGTLFAFGPPVTPFTPRWWQALTPPIPPAFILMPQIVT
jgi:hypothetical protein